MTLPARFQEPASFKWGHFTNADGASIRYGSLQPEGTPKGTIVLTSGFREATEKYFEVIRDMAEQGYAVWMMDWRGQGGSDRYIKDNPQKMYSEGYDKSIADLHQFATGVVKKSDGPLIMMSHSMGGHIGLRYLKEHDGVFDSAVFTAPMLDIVTPGYPRKVVQLLTKAARVGRFLGDYVPTAGDWHLEPFETNKLTSDPERYMVLPAIYKEKPELIMGEPTYGWLLHTLVSIDALQKEDYLKSIKTPVLIGVAGKDEVVSIAAEDRACKLIPNCIRVDVPEAKHEIWMERDSMRGPWIKRVFEFLDERTRQHKLQPKNPRGNNVQGPRGLG